MNCFTDNGSLLLGILQRKSCAGRKMVFILWNYVFSMLCNTSRFAKLQLRVGTNSFLHALPFACRVCWIHHCLCSRVVIRGSYKSLVSCGKTNGKVTSVLRRWLCAQQWDGLKHILHIPDGEDEWEMHSWSLIPLLLRLWGLCFV